MPWQHQLLSRIDAGCWPTTLVLPWDKAALLEIAVFALACQADRSPAERQMPRRICWLSDRYPSLDTIGAHAQRLAAALATGTGVVAAVAEALLRYGGEQPLQVVTLGAGLYGHDTAIEQPQQPVIVLSTIAQAGSRLLFRGYGLAPSQWPVQAGLLSNDALWLVDSSSPQPLSETLAAVAKYRGWAQRPLPAPFKAMLISAQPVTGGDEVFKLTAADYQQAALRERWRTPQPALLTTSDAASGAAVLATHARTLAQLAEVKVVAVIVNELSTARAVFERLCNDSSSVKLLTGRQRPGAHARLSTQFQSDGRPRFIVATQTLEAEVEFECDALVTEAAPLEALWRRFVCLKRAARQVTGNAVVILRKQPRGRADPVYGAALTAAWRWLQNHAQERDKQRWFDFGGEAFWEKITAADPQPAPVMLPSHVDLWTRTAPPPQPDPAVAPFLYGARAGSADVQIVWRADLLLADEANWAAIVALLPPLPDEALAVPISAAQAWLRRQDGGVVTDLEGVEPAPAGSTLIRGRRVLRWRGPADSDLVTASQLQPGDTLVVPAQWGGADAFGWQPRCTAAVTDLAEACWTARLQSLPQQVYRLRLQPALVPADGRLPACLQDLLAALAVPEVDAAVEQALQALLPALTELASARPECAAAVTALQTGLPQLLCYPGRPPPGVVLTTGKLPFFTDADDTSSLTVPTPLATHLDGVARRAERFARACGLPAALVDDLRLAGELHDLGKAEPRFQRLLHGGDRLAAALAEQPLAKGGLDPTDILSWQRAWQCAGLPVGFRHEGVSVALAEVEHDRLSQAHDAELVTYLIGVHHGRGRCFQPVCSDPAPTTVTVDYRGRNFRAGSEHGLHRLERGWTALFWKLVGRYGAWGLAYCEALLRLADRAQTQEEYRR